MNTASFQFSCPLNNNSLPQLHYGQKQSVDTPASVQPQSPFLVSDFLATRVQILHSSIRSNDRGKEVLSFVIMVDPGSGKEPWKIDKSYSDFISLDRKIRSANRGLNKKTLSLPDNKLWRDHAPAKVDRLKVSSRFSVRLPLTYVSRSLVKVALGKYLQELLLLPIKDQNEILAFFTSYVVRARQPVSSAGYKEGYLTKRGKNFGGWRRRYFVLQGSVLEYYESVRLSL